MHILQCIALLLFVFCGLSYGKKGYKNVAESLNLQQGEKKAETIDIDRMQNDGPAVEGSGQPTTASSGAGPDDEDSESDSSGTLPITTAQSRTECERLREEARSRKLLGAPIFKCTKEGEFEPLQCMGSVCYCVDMRGIEIPYTKHRPETSVTIDCYQERRNFVKKIKTSPRLQNSDTDEWPRINSVNPGSDREKYPTKQINGADQLGSDGVYLDPKPSESETDEKASDTKEQKDKGGLDPLPKGEGTAAAATSVMARPGMLAGIIAGATVGLLCAILLGMFIFYRMRKKDEGSYALEEPKHSPSMHMYQKAPTREFYA